MMITEASKITIETSPELSALKLDGIAQRRGVVLECLTDPARRLPGYMVRLDEKYLDEYVWFIPAQSVRKA